MSKLFAGAQNLGKSFMLPIAVLPAAGLLLGFGGVFTNPVTISTYPALNSEVIQAIFTVMKLCGSVVFDNLSAVCRGHRCRYGTKRQGNGRSCCSTLLYRHEQGDQRVTIAIWNAGLRESGRSRAGECNGDHYATNRRDGRDHERSAGLLGSKAVWQNRATQSAGLFQRLPFRAYCQFLFCHLPRGGAVLGLASYPDGHYPSGGLVEKPVMLGPCSTA